MPSTTATSSPRSGGPTATPSCRQRRPFSDSSPTCAGAKISGGLALPFLSWAMAWGSWVGKRHWAFSDFSLPTNSLIVMDRGPIGYVHSRPRAFWPWAISSYTRLRALESMGRVYISIPFPNGVATSPPHPPASLNLLPSSSFPCPLNWLSEHLACTALCFSCLSCLPSPLRQPVSFCGAEALRRNENYCSGWLSDRWLQYFQYLPPSPRDASSYSLPSVAARGSACSSKKAWRAPVKNCRSSFAH